MRSWKKLGIILMGLFLAALLFVVGCGGAKTTNKQQSEVPKTEAKALVKGTVYLPGMGGHIAVADLEIDPSNSEDPLKVKKLDRIKLGAPETNATHDIRIDQGKGVAYSAAYVKGSDGKVRVVKIDLETMQPIKEISTSPSERFVGDGPMYCASGQSKDMFLPVMMGYEGWIDVIGKESLDLKHRVYFDDPKMTKDYIFAHGIQTPDMQQFLLTLNATSKEKAGKMPPRDNPDILFYLLDMGALEQGKLDVKQSGKIAGDPAATIAFRQNFTSDGKYLLQSARDRVLVVDAKTLELVRKVDIPKEADGQLECHDVIATADGKYAILALRAPMSVEGADKPINDGKIMLMDVEKGELIGNAVSVCRGCHDDYNSLKTKEANLCGIDAIWND